MISKCWRIGESKRTMEKSTVSLEPCALHGAHISFRFVSLQDNKREVNCNSTTLISTCLAPYDQWMINTETCYTIIVQTYQIDAMMHCDSWCVLFTVYDSHSRTNTPSLKCPSQNNFFFTLSDLPCNFNDVNFCWSCCFCVRCCVYLM